MSEQEFELYLKLLSRCLNLTAAQREQIADELRDHLQERLEELSQAGVPREKAVVQALDEFGDAAVLAADFASIARLKRRRFLMRLSLGSVAALAAAMLVAYAFWPENHVVQTPPRVVAQEKTRPASRVENKGTPATGSVQLSLASDKTRAGSQVPPTVDVCHPVQREITDRVVSVGTVVASQSVSIRSQATGYLKKIHFRAGQVVKEGDVLFEIDSQLQEAELNKAQAEVVRAEVQIKGATAKLGLLENAYKLSQVPAAPVARCRGDVDTARAELVVAKANYEIAKVRLSYAKIMAPISGRMSRSNIDVGNLIKADESVLATLSCTDPIEVAFAVAQSNWIEMRKAIRELQFKNSKVPVEVSLDGQFDLPLVTSLESVDGNIDRSTGSVRALAALPNADGMLIPGMFVHVRLQMSRRRQALLIPTRAVGNASVLIVNDHNVIERRNVKVGSVHSNLREVTEGLKPGEWVAVDARDEHGNMPKLDPGMTVKPQPVVIP